MTAPTPQDRLAVHRCVEYLRCHEGWPQEGDDPGRIVQQLGLPRPATPAGRALLEDELARWAERRESLGADSGLERYNDWLWEHPEGVVSDPYGELEGGRPGCVRLLGRRVDRAVREG